MTHYYAESTGQSDTTETSWQEKLAYTVVEAGDYLVQWTYELTANGATFHCRAQVEHESIGITELACIQFEPEDINPAFWLGGAGFRKLTLAVDDIIRINWCSETAAGTSSIRNAAIFLLKL